MKAARPRKQTLACRGSHTRAAKWHRTRRPERQWYLRGDGRESRKGEGVREGAGHPFGPNKGRTGGAWPGRMSTIHGRQPVEPATGKEMGARNARRGALRAARHLVPTPSLQVPTEAQLRQGAAQPHRLDRRGDLDQPRRPRLRDAKLSVNGVMGKARCVKSRRVKDADESFWLEYPVQAAWERARLPVVWPKGSNPQCCLSTSTITSTKGSSPRHRELGSTTRPQKRSISIS